MYVVSALYVLNRHTEIIVEVEIRVLNKIALKVTHAKIPQQCQCGGVLDGAGNDIDFLVQYLINEFF